MVGLNEDSEKQDIDKITGRLIEMQTKLPSF